MLAHEHIAGARCSAQLSSFRAGRCRSQQAAGTDLRSRGGVTELLLGECWMRPRLQERLACPLAARLSRALGLLAEAGSTHTTSQHSEPTGVRLERCATNAQLLPGIAWD